jgi:pimeloyl-ACP methyl ester carboxylesterase
MHGIYEDGRQLAPEAALMSEYGIPFLNIVLAGHGDTNEFANDLVYQDWIEEAERALRLAKALGGRAILIGHSTGGVLSAYLALKHPDEVAALVLIEPAIRVTRTVTTAACVSQHGIANIADYPELLKLDGTDPASLHNRVISPSAGCQVHFLRKAMLSLLPHAREEEVALSTPGSNPIADPAQEKRWTSNELKNSQAMGELLHAPLLFMINRHDLVVDYDNNRAFLRGASQNVNVRSYIFNQDWKMRHGSITFEGVDLILPQLRSFINSVIGSGARSESYRQRER